MKHRADKVTEAPQIDGFGVRRTDGLVAELKEDVVGLADRREDYREIHGGYSHARVAVTLEGLAPTPNGKTVWSGLRQRSCDGQVRRPDSP